MNPTAAAIRAGWSRGLIELRQSFTNGGDLWGHFFWPVLMLAVMYFMRDTAFGSSGLLLGTLALPSIVGRNVALGMVSMSQQLTAEREDGTLLRAKATPNGMRGYLVGKVVTVAGGLLADLGIFLIPGIFIIEGLAVGPASWLTLAWVLVLGMVATLPIGAVLGSVFSSARGQGLMQLPILGMIAISGIFYPITSMPEWLQWIAQVAPIYWLGLGMRSALLPDAAVGVEIGEIVAAPGNHRGAGGLGRARPRRGADRPTPDGAPGVGIERGRAPREGLAAGRVRRMMWLWAVIKATGSRQGIQIAGSLNPASAAPVGPLSGVAGPCRRGFTHTAQQSPAFSHGEIRDRIDAVVAAGEEFVPVERHVSVCGHHMLLHQRQRCLRALAGGLLGQLQQQVHQPAPGVGESAVVQASWSGGEDDVEPGAASAHEAHVGPGGRREPLGRILPRAFGRLPELLRQFRGGLRRDRGHQVVTVGKVPVRRRCADPQPAGDLRHGKSRQSRLREQVEAGLYQCRPQLAVVVAAAPLRTAV
jgi:ABC-2 type transport system permease protein